jgi:hypothetical protein
MAVIAHSKLARLAKSINREHKGVKDAEHKAGLFMVDSVHHAKKAGDLLLKVKEILAKRDVGLDTFKHFIATQTRMSRRTASNYTRVAENWSRVQHLLNPDQKPSIRKIIDYLKGGLPGKGLPFEFADFLQEQMHRVDLGMRRVCEKAIRQAVSNFHLGDCVPFEVAVSKVMQNEIAEAICGAAERARRFSEIVIPAWEEVTRKKWDVKIRSRLNDELFLQMCHDGSFVQIDRDAATNACAELCCIAPFSHLERKLAIEWLESKRSLLDVDAVERLESAVRADAEATLDPHGCPKCRAANVAPAVPPNVTTASVG